MDARTTYLHRARVARGLSLEDLAYRTALSRGVVTKIDEGRLAELPPGLYARSYIRSFAAEVGVEPEVALATLEPILPPAPDPLPVLREVRSTPPATLNLQLARISAAALDALLLLATVVMPVLLLASWSSGVPVPVLLARAGGALAAFCVVPLALYFVVFDGIGGATPGCRVFGVCEPGTAIPGTPTPLKLPEILKRVVSH